MTNNKVGSVSTATFQKSWVEWLFDTLCIASIIGIYPRFIEPRFLFTSRQRISLPALPPSLDGMKVLLLSDLHINHYSSPRFLLRLQKAIVLLSPDLILFSGDLLTYSQLPREDLAATFFDGLRPPLGLFACLGNHDYKEYSTLDSSGQAVAGYPNGHPILQGLKRLFKTSRSPRQHPLSSPLPLNKELLRFYSDHNVTVLENETVRIGHGTQRINLTGFGDITSGHFSPTTAYNGYDLRLPGIVFGHSPDIYSHLSYFPGDLFLFGHTHGGQINLPFLWERITPLNDKSLKSGLYQRDGRTVFVTRGVGTTFPFRLFAPPQIVLFELFRGGRVPSEALAPSLFEPASATPSFAAHRVVTSEETSP
jgi:predicted MPP superfamily phosphohydrolase